MASPRLVIKVTEARNILILRQTNPIKISHYISVRCILILYSHLRLGLPSDFSQGFPTKTLYVFLLSAYVPSASSWIYHLFNFVLGEYTIKLLITWFYPVSFTYPLFGPVILLSTSDSQTQVNVLPITSETKFHTHTQQPAIQVPYV
jgi:hypothetical protein